MVDVTITAANVAKGTGAQVHYGTAGATITAGQVVYKDTSDGDKIKLADANLNVNAARAIGIALHGALAGQPIAYQAGGEITIGGTLVVGGIYVLSGTAGGIAPAADNVTGFFTCVLGVAKTAAILKLGLVSAGVAVP